MPRGKTETVLISLRLPLITREQIAALQAKTGLNKTDVIKLAVHELHASYCPAKDAA